MISSLPELKEKNNTDNLLTPMSSVVVSNEVQLLRYCT